MDIYLVLIDGKYQFLTGPTKEQLIGAEIVAQRPNVSLCYDRQVKFHMLDAAAHHMYRKSLQHEMLPARIKAFTDSATDFLSEVPECFKLNWEIFTKLGINTLMQNGQNTPNIA